MSRDMQQGRSSTAMMLKPSNPQEPSPGPWLTIFCYMLCSPSNRKLYISGPWQNNLDPSLLDNLRTRLIMFATYVRNCRVKSILRYLHLNWKPTIPLHFQPSNCLFKILFWIWVDTHIQWEDKGAVSWRWSSDNHSTGSRSPVIPMWCKNGTNYGLS